MKHMVSLFKMENYIKELMGELSKLDEFSAAYANKHVKTEIRIPFFSALTGSVNLPKLREKLSGSIEIPLEELLKDAPFDTSNLSYTFNYAPDIDTEKIVRGKYSAKLSVAADEKKSRHKQSEELCNLMEAIGYVADEITSDIMGLFNFSDLKNYVSHFGIKKYSELIKRVSGYIRDLNDKYKREGEEKAKIEIAKLLDGKVTFCNAYSNDGTEIFIKAGTVITPEIIAEANKQDLIYELYRASREIDVDEFLNEVRQTEEIDQTGKGKTEGTEQESLSEIFEKRQIKYMMGKRVITDVLSDSGTLIVKEGDVVDEDVIERAKQHGQFLRLSMNLDTGV